MAVVVVALVVNEICWPAYPIVTTVVSVNTFATIDSDVAAVDVDSVVDTGPGVDGIVALVDRLAG